MEASIVIDIMEKFSIYQHRWGSLGLAVENSDHTTGDGWQNEWVPTEMLSIAQRLTRCGLLPFHRLESEAFPAALPVSHESTRLVRSFDALSFTDHVFFVEFAVRVELGTG